MTNPRKIAALIGAVIIIAITSHARAACGESYQAAIDSQESYWSQAYSPKYTTQARIDEYTANLNELKAKRDAEQQKCAVVDAETKAAIALEAAAAKAEVARLAKLPNPRIGMSAKTVLTKTKYGAPQEINRTVGRGYVHEQWVYGSTYLYFDNGILTAFQD